MSMKVDALRRSLIVALTALVVGATFPTVALADEAEDRKAEAQRLFAEGQAALDKGDNTTACPLMRKSLKLFAVANALFNVAQCDERDGKLNSALEHWKHGLSVVDAKDKRAPVVNKAIEDLGIRIPRVRIMVSSKDEPLDVLLDGEVVPKNKLESAIFVDPGKHVITVRKQGHEDRRVEVLLNERERTEVVAEAGEANAGPVCPALPRPPPNVKPLKVSAYAALGLGAVAFIGAATTGGLIVSNDTKINESCPLKVCGAGRPTEVINTQSKLVPLNGIFWGVGLASAASGAVMLVLANQLGKENKAPIVAPLILRDGGGIGFSGRF